MIPVVETQRFIDPPRSEGASLLGIGMRSYPRQQLYTPLHEKRRQYRPILYAERAVALIAVQPARDPFRRGGIMFDKTYCRRQIVEIPAEAAVVEINYPGVILTPHDVGQPQISVNEPKTRGRLAITVQGVCRPAEAIFDKGAIVRPQAGNFSPVSPVPLHADHRVVVPGQAAEPGR
ncbi:hypothetical protein SG2071 [Sodalis glossinidius str. 'morsitans']|uniref:Uncharacterized protein n=1 Tax=Sodalis glossinidius (strain morsitans) TaxID=343509 RepID=Q2NR79_SODGM|nr:hypothetical protein SG2071 [Sodalis glossinidius str. 'morsitans']